MIPTKITNCSHPIFNTLKIVLIEFPFKSPIPTKITNWSYVTLLEFPMLLIHIEITNSH